MDYVDKRLKAADGADVGQIGFSYRLNGDQFCKELKTIFTPGKQFNTPQCYKSMSTAIDDFDELFKECDQETECCVNGKWVHALANCYENDGECCSNCQKPDIPRTCTFKDNNPNSGICNNGKCELFGKVDTAVCAIHTKRVCTQEKLFYAVHSNQERCRTQCWVFDQQCAGPSYFHDYHNQMDLYSPCYRTSGPNHDFSTPPVKGRCLPDPDPQQSGVIRCYGPGDAQYDTLWAGRFQWEAILTNEPYCKNANFTNNVQPKYILLCRGPEGNTVGADHCKDVPKPTSYQPTLDCATHVKDFTTKYDTTVGEQITPKWKYTVGSNVPSGPHYATLSLYVKGQEYALIDTQVNLRDQQYVYTLLQGLPPTRNAYFLLQNNGVRIYTNKFTHAGGGDDTYIPPVPDNSGGGDGGDNGG